MPQLMYKEDRELLVTDNAEGRAIMRKQGWSDDKPEAPKPEQKKNGKKGGK